MELLYITADWCQPCKVFGPIMEKVKDEIKVTKIDITEDPHAIGYHLVMSVPTVILVQQGEERSRLVGAQTEETIRNWFRSYSLGA